MAISLRVRSDGLHADDRWRPSLVELAGGVEEPRAEPKAHCHAEAIAQRDPRRLQHEGLVVPGVGEHLQGQVIAWAHEREQVGDRSDEQLDAALLEHLAGRRLGGRDVRLVERLHAERGPGEGGGELQGDDGVPDLGLRRADRERHHGMACPRQLLERRRAEEEPIVAVHVGRAHRLPDDRCDAGAVLPERLGHELLDPQPERGDLGRQDEGRLVPA